MATKDITDLQVVQAYSARLGDPWKRSALTRLMQETSQPQKVCLRAMERAVQNGLVDYGTCVEWGFLTDNGKALLSADIAPPAPSALR